VECDTWGTELYLQYSLGTLTAWTVFALGSAVFLNFELKLFVRFGGFFYHTILPL
jgi:hypothetical protein